MRYLAVLAALVMVTGCSVSMNIQRSSIRSASDVVTTVKLDKTDLEQVDTVKADIKAVAEKILKFLEDNDNSVIPFDQLQAKLCENIDDRLKPFVEQLVKQLKKFVKADKLGPNTIKRGKAFCYGVINSCDKYYNADRLEDD